MSTVHTDKCGLIINKIQSSGFILYFLQHYFVLFELANPDTKILEKISAITLLGEWSLCEDKLLFTDPQGKIWCVSDNESGFFEMFVGCVYPLCFHNAVAYSNATRTEYKNAWFVDKKRQIVYFKFRHCCGEGAVKRTYLGWNITQQKPCVVYQITVPVNNTDQKRCINEKRIAEIEKSPYLLTIHYSTMNRDLRKFYMITDFCRYNVRQMILDHYPWTLGDLKTFSHHILQGLKVLHDMNVIHRDVKPSNIIFDHSVYKLIDFGIATKLNSMSNLQKFETLNHFTESDDLSLVGTPGYISPEMYNCLYSLKKNNYNHGVDIFSFGITLLEMYLGERAYQQDFIKLPDIIKAELLDKESQFESTLEQDVEFLKNQFKLLEETKHIENNLRSEIQEKIDIIHQLKKCGGDKEDRDMYISELIDKNKSISYYCNKMSAAHHQSVDALDKNTLSEYEFISKMKTLCFYAKKMDVFYNNQDLEELLNDPQMYCLLYATSSYHLPLSLERVEDPLLFDFLKKCLCKNPLERATIQNLLEHEWLTL